MDFSAPFTITGNVFIDTDDIRSWLLDHPGETVNEAFRYLATDKILESMKLQESDIWVGEEIIVGKVETNHSMILPSDTQLPCKECDGEPGKCECLDCGIAIIEKEADYDHYCGACSYKNARL